MSGTGTIGSRRRRASANHSSTVRRSSGGLNNASSSSARVKRSTRVWYSGRSATSAMPSMWQNDRHWSGVKAVTPSQPSRQG